MRTFARVTTTLLSAGALTVALATPAQAAPNDITVPLGGTCVINVSQFRIDGDCTLQAIGGAIATAVAVVGLGSLSAGSLGNSGGNPPVTPSPDKGPLEAESYLFEAGMVDGIGVVGVQYIGEVPPNAGTYELRREHSDGQTFIFNPDTPVGDGMGGTWVDGESGRFAVVYTPVSGDPVEVAYYYYGDSTPE